MKRERKTISARQYYLNLWYGAYTISFLIAAAIAIFLGPWWALFPAIWVGYCIGRHELVIRRAAELDEPRSG